MSGQAKFVCSDKLLRDKCSYLNKRGDLYRGSCQLFSETLMCVRSLPIVKAESNDKSEHQHEHGLESGQDH